MCSRKARVVVLTVVMIFSTILSESFGQAGTTGELPRNRRLAPPSPYIPSVTVEP
jgi:hypothetical protein